MTRPHVPPPRASRFGSPLVLSRAHWLHPELVAQGEISHRTEDNLYPCGEARGPGYLAGLTCGGARPALRSSAMIWRRFSMPSLVKAGTPPATAR